MKLRDRLSYFYRMGWRAYKKSEIKHPVVELRKMFPEKWFEEEEGSYLVYIKDKYKR